VRPENDLFPSVVPIGVADSYLNPDSREVQILKSSIKMYEKLKAEDDVKNYDHLIK